MTQYNIYNSNFNFPYEFFFQVTFLIQVEKIIFRLNADAIIFETKISKQNKKKMLL